MAHRICYREPQDALREGWAVAGSVRGVTLENDPETQKAWSAWFKRLDVPGLVIRARATAKAHGGAAWVMWIDDGRASDQPVDWTSIHSIKWIKVLRGGRDGLVQPTDHETDPRSARFQLPRAYNVSFPAGGSGVFHWTRVVIWQGIVNDEEDLVANNGWGEAKLELVWTTIKNFGAAHQYALGALLKLSQGVFQSQYLAGAIAAGNRNQAMARLEDVSLGAGLYGEIGIGADESYAIAGRPISGADALLAAFGNALVAATDMPEIVLMGRRPGGLSTAADGEFRGWYDFVASLRDPHYTPALVRLIELGSRAATGPTGGIPVIDPGVEWPPLWQLTEAEKLANRKLAAESRSIDGASGSATPAEIRTDPDLDTWYQQGAITPPPEEEAAALEDVEVADQALLPDGETLISLREAADLLNYRGTSAARKIASQHGALFKPGAQYRVARGMLMAGLRGSQVAAPAEPVVS
jgi:phage-related protein (TIGR01555 family)